MLLSRLPKQLQMTYTTFLKRKLNLHFLNNPDIKHPCIHVCIVLNKVSLSINDRENTYIITKL